MITKNFSTIQQRFPKLLAIIFFSVMLSSCDFLYSLVDKEGAQEKKLIGQISPFEANPKVKEIQKLLAAYSYKIGNPDGVLGPQTRVVIQNFQKDAGIKQTRYLDKATVEKVFELSKYQLVVEDKLNYKLIQEILRTAGLDPGPADGKPGKRTKDALISFQKENGLKADGTIDYPTLLKMKEYLSFE